jgi:ABC-2 type transport system permease protein
MIAREPGPTVTAEATAALVGTSALTHSALRRERGRIAAWVLGIVALVVATIGSIEGLYPTAADLEQAARASRDNAAAIVFNGPPQGLDTVGGQVAFQAGAFGLVMVGLMSMFMLGRLTRGEEEAGRLELLRSLPIGAHSPTAAALMIVLAMDVAVGVSVAVTSIALGLPLMGSVVFGTSFALFGVFFASVTLVATQLSPFTRVAYGITGAALGASFALRAIGDVGDGSVSWLSPIGWAQKARPFAGNAWWPFLVLLAGTAALVVLAANLASRRDLGGGLLSGHF